LDDTTPMTQPAPMKTGSNTITIDNAQPTSYVLVWITTLGTVDGKSETAISGITLKPTS
jgi:putative peptidoglycan lipid II flippase